MSNLSRHRVDTEVEKKLLTGLAVSDKVCRDLLPVVDLKTLQSSYIARVVGWIKLYYQQYEKAPGKHLRDIFESEKKKLDSSEANLIEKFLTDLSFRYEEQATFNVDYLVDQCVEYLDERTLLALSDRIREATVAGQTGRAKNLIAEYRKTAKATSSWVNPFEISEVNRAMDIGQDVLFSFPGKLGALVGHFERGFFVGFLAPMKKGKTWMLLELATLAMLNKLKVVFISLEMKDKRMQRRFYKRLSSATKYGGLLAYPCMDCLHNQDGSCEKEERTNKTELRDEDGNKPEFDVKLKYRPCTYCRKENPKEFFADYWYVMVERPKFEMGLIRRVVRSFTKTFGDDFRLICYPRFSANISDVTRDLDLLEWTEGFVPDVIIVDYADILAHERERDDTRAMVDETWMTLAQMADKRNALVVTVSQAGKQSWDRKTVRAKDITEDYRKMAHVDIMCSLNQTMEEKDKGLMRIGVVAHREEDFNDFRQVTVLQQLAAGQSLIDSEFIREEE